MELHEVIDEMHAALAAFVRGDAAPMQALLSTADDVTLANPFGPPVRGRAAVLDATDRAATLYRDGDVVRVERISERTTAELACIVEVEHLRATIGEGTAPTSFALRVTTVFAREGGTWRIIVRHADPTTQPRSAAEVFSTAP